MKAWIEKQFPNLFLWTPFVMAGGSAMYFAMGTEPQIHYPLIIALLCALIIIIRKPNVILTGVLLFIFGFMYANGFTRLIDTPKMSRDLRNIEISGIVTDIDYTTDKTRAYVRVPANMVNWKLSENRFANIRVSIGNDLMIPNIGDKIDAVVTLYKPSGPSAPGTFDYSRWAYFNGLTATGYLNSYKTEPANNAQVSNVNSLRNKIHQTTNSFLSDTLVLGYKNVIPDNENEIWKTNGIAHVWSISGFHMTLVAGWLFAIFFVLFRSVPSLTRRIPARYPAMIAAWIGLLFYLFISGTGVATIRAFLMTTLVFAAFLFGRNSFSMRNICMVFIFVFLLNPHYVTEAGFQLSFAAVFGLIWYFRDGEYKKLTFRRKVWRMIRATAMTDIIATLFTMPFIAAHFHNIPIYSLLGNMILLPIFSLAVMPLVMIGTITSMFGFNYPLLLTHDVYDLALRIATWISELPFAKMQIPSISNFALPIMVFGFLCLILIVNPDNPKYKIFKHMNKLLFVTFITVGIVSIAVKPKPVFYATSDHELVAFNHHGKLEFNKARASNHYFAFDTWKQFNFEDTGTENKRHKCKSGVCVYETDKWKLAYMQRFMPLYKNIVEFCRDDEIKYIVSYFDIDAPKCNHKILRGGFVIYPSGNVEYVPTNRYWM